MTEAMALGGLGVHVGTRSRGRDTLDAVIHLVKTLEGDEGQGHMYQTVINTVMVLAFAGMIWLSALVGVRRFGFGKKLLIVVDQMTQTDDKTTRDVHSQCDRPSGGPAVGARAGPSGGPASIFTPSPALARSYAQAYPARPPSEAQVAYLQGLSSRVGEAIPAEALTDATEASRVLTMWERRPGVHRRPPP